MNIGKSVVIKGELSGSEDLTIEGNVEGKIELKDNTLTIGPNGKIRAEVFAKQVIVLGEVTGNVTASEKVDIRDNGSVDGDITSPRVAIAEGAHFRGAIDMQQKSGSPRPAPPPRSRRRRRARGGQGRRLALAARGQRPGLRARSRLWLADCTISCPGSAAGVTSRRGAPALAAARDTPELVYPTKALPKFLANVAVEAGAGAARPGPGRRQQRRRSSASSSAAACASRTWSPTSSATPRPARSTSCRRSSARGSRASRAASTASSAGTCSTSSIGRRRTALAATLAQAAGRRRLAARLLQHRHRTRTGALHQVRRRRSRHPALSHLHGTQARQRSLQNRDIIKLFETLRVSDSFLMKTNMREIIFRKPAYLAGL